MSEFPLTAILDVDFSALAARHGMQKFHARILQDAIWKQPVGSLQEITSLPEAARRSLAASERLHSLALHTTDESADGTRKFLWTVAGGDFIESVLIPNDEGDVTACISTQVGCAMRCDFCASTKNGWKRDLAYYEIAEQVLLMQAVLPKGKRIDRIVVMGIGEPLANFDSLIRALELLNREDLFGIGARRITVSTVGIPRGIERFAEVPKQYNLAISLHAPNDMLRTRIIPTNTGTGIGAILGAADAYFQKSGREYTIEYILLRGVNDSADLAHELGRLLAGRRCVVNLIPMNAIADAAYQPPTEMEIRRFREVLQDGYRIPTHVRRRRGSDIGAACGQLRLNRLRQTSVTSSDTGG